MITNNRKPLHLFEGYGVELEYMEVDTTTLEVLPVTDRIMYAEGGKYIDELPRGTISWSNEIMLHVIELKTNGPVPSFVRLDDEFSKNIEKINRLLKKMGGRLMPGAMHPFMDPVSEMRLWPHEYNQVYNAFDRIFSCKGHGWANLQSAHINLPFANDEEFGRLHASIRMVLPLIPALAASSPIIEGRYTGLADTRLHVYRTNAEKIPSVTGDIIPEPVFDMSAYHETILQRVYRDLASYDPEGALQEEWVNARGAIARFDRKTIEIRIIDIQEHPKADLAIAAAIIGLIRALVEERLVSYEKQKRWPVATLRKLLLETIRVGEYAVIDNPLYLSQLGYTTAEKCTAQQLWAHVIHFLGKTQPGWMGLHMSNLEKIIEKGTLSTRIKRKIGPSPTREKLIPVYRELCDCLEQGVLLEE